MADDPIKRAMKRVWDARYMRILAKLEQEQRLRERCGGCGRTFGDHPNDYDECIRKVLATD